MDFFAQQDKAKRYTKILFLYFLSAIALIVIAVNLVIYYSFLYLELYPYTPTDWFSNGVVYYVSGATCALIVSGSLYRWFKLKSGGHAVAAMLGAKRINLHTSDAKRRQLINVVEEMSIASGVPLPSLYVLESEAGINAFVAGYLPTEAVMVVTAGAIDNFTREEMQGVVAHEYSHILNGDMRINIRLMAILAGILMISSVGHLILNGSRPSYARSSRDRDSGSLAIVGIALLVVGYIGVFFGRLIKAAVSRQREYLADAASVQFTRNPQGIASALNTIREVSEGSKINNAFAEDMSHMCFAQAFSMRMTQWLATHPPLMERIKCIDPSYVARIKARKLNQSSNNQVGSQVSDFSESSEASSVGVVMGFSEVVEPAPITPQALAQTTGNIDQSHIEFAIKIHQSFSDELMLAVHQLDTARLLVLNIILAKMNIETGLNFLNDKLNKNEIKELLKFKEEISRLENFKRLPLFEMLLPTLKQMEEREKPGYLILCENLIKCDKRYTLFEYILLSLLKQSLSPLTGYNVKTKYHSFKSVNKELQVLFSVMAHSSQGSADARNESYDKVAHSFPMKVSGKPLKLLEIKEITPNKISKALKCLAQISSQLKKSVLEAAADIAMHDAQIKYTEAELLRAIASMLDCPLPPLLPQAIN